jgi:hypothetical protein
MSYKTWSKEFYPCCADSPEARAKPTAHSLQKWIGLRPENLAKHGVSFTDGVVTGEGRESALRIDAKSCALCAKHYDTDAEEREVDDPDWSGTPECEECPLHEVRGNTACDRLMSGEHHSPYSKGTNGNPPDPEPMILWLLNAKEAYGD